jgi:hypothetical protein
MLGQRPLNKKNIFQNQKLIPEFNFAKKIFCARKKKIMIYFF